jgi:hypothetical protein
MTTLQAKRDYVRAAPKEAGEHTCHALECEKHIAPKFFMCPSHWSKVPRSLQAAVWRHYRPGQEIDKSPTDDYLDVIYQAMIAVATAERKVIPEWLQIRANRKRKKVSQGVMPGIVT